MPYAGGEIPKVGDTVRHKSGKVGTVFELDLQTDHTPKNGKIADERIKVKFDDGTSATTLASEFKLVKRPSE